MKFLMELLNRSVTGGAAIVLCCIVVFLLRKKIRARSEKKVWILIALYMLLPLGIVKLPHAYEVKLPDIVLTEHVSPQIAGRNTGIETRNQEAKQLGNAETIKQDNPFQDSGGMKQAVSETEVKTTEITFQGIAFAIWLCICVILTVYHLVSYWKLRRRMIRWSSECVDESIKKLFFETAEEVGLKKIPMLRIINDESIGPFTMGITKSIIFVPESKMNESDLSYILRHELTHCNEKDTLWELVWLVDCIVHWFNPFVWLMRMFAQLSMEKACDEEILKDATMDERIEYSDVILSWVEKSGVKRSPLSTGYVQGMTFLKLRFANILDSSVKTDSKTIAAGAVIVIVLLTCILDIGAGERIRQINGLDSNLVTVSYLPETTQDSNLVTVSYLPETTQDTDNGEAVSAGKIGIDFGTEPRTDLNGDGREDRVRVMNVRSGDAAYIQIIANVDGVDVASKDFDGHYSGGTLTTGDLSGDGIADVLLKRGVFGSNYGAIEISILHLEDEGWVEYPYNFIPNPDIPLRCPVSFEPDESWKNGDYYVGATLFEKDGMTMVRFIILDYEEYDLEIVRVIEASWQEEGWYIENVEVVDNYYTEEKYVDLEAPFYRIR